MPPDMDLQIFFAFLLYFSVLLLIGLFSHRKSQSETDFILGNRSLSFWLTALSAHASDMSAWLFMSLPMLIFVYGLSKAWVAIGLFIGMFVNWHFIAPKLREGTEKSDSYTLPTFFERRFNDASGAIRLLTASLTLLFLTFYLSGGLIAMGYLFEAIFGIDYYVGITIAISVMVAYTFVGGFVAVAWTDFFQALFLLFVIITVPFLALGKIGGSETVERVAQFRGISLEIFGNLTLASIGFIVIDALGWGLGYFGQPHIVTKFMGIRNVNEMKKAKWLGMSWQFLSLTGAVLVGLVGIGFFPEGLYNPELVFVEMVKSSFPLFLAGVILCAILAANLSTMDSQIIVAASVITEDFYKRLSSKVPTSAQLLKASRTAVVAVGLTAYLLATSKSSNVLDSIFYAWGGLGSSFGPLLWVTLYSKRVTLQGAIAGILVGGFMGIFWTSLNPLILSWEVPTLVPGFLFGLISIYLISYLTKSP